MKESDLYLPIKQLLESQGYEVKGEIEHCDVMAVRGDESPVIIELKLTLNLNVILQAVDRLNLTSKVYIGVPKQCKVLQKNGKRTTKLLRMLGLGLLVVNKNRKVPRADILFDPGDYQPKKSAYRQERLLGEFAQRMGDPNQGGQETRKGVVTAYRQNAMAIARFLSDNGPSKASHVADVLHQSKARDILYNNVYGWFERVSLGVYELSPRGIREILLWQDVSAPDAETPNHPIKNQIKRSANS